MKPSQMASVRAAVQYFTTKRSRELQFHLEFAISNFLILEATNSFLNHFHFAESVFMRKLFSRKLYRNKTVKEKL